MTEKPSLEVVLAYAKPIIFKCIAKYASDIPKEQKEEIEQEAYIKVLKMYESLEADLGWKSFVYLHVTGAVKDYMKAGNGFKEDSWSIRKEEEHEAVHVSKIRNRVSLVNSDDDDVSIDQILGANDKFTLPTVDLPRINWEHLARMAFTDFQLQAFLWDLTGESHEDIGVIMGYSRAAVGKMIKDFHARFDDPEWASNPSKKMWFDQIIWCLGIASHFNIKDCDQKKIHGVSIGHSGPSVNFFNDPNINPDFESNSSIQFDLFVH